MSFQAWGDWIIKGNIKEGDRRTISELRFRAELHKGRETTTGQSPRRQKISVLFCFCDCNTLQKRKEKKKSKDTETFPPFYSRLRKA